MPPTTSLSLSASEKASRQTLRRQLPRGPSTQQGREVLSCGQGTGRAALRNFRPLMAVERDAVNRGNEKRPDAVQAAAREGHLTRPPVPSQAQKGEGGPDREVVGL